MSGRSLWLIKILSVVCVKAITGEDVMEDMEPVIALSTNKMRVINTKESVSDQSRVIHPTLLPSAILSSSHRTLIKLKPLNSMTKIQ